MRIMCNALYLKIIKMLQKFNSTHMIITYINLHIKLI